MRKTSLIAALALAAAARTAAAQKDAGEARWANPQGAQETARAISGARAVAAPAVAALAAAAPEAAKTPAQLLQMKRGELEALYKTRAAGPIPDGESDGLASSAPGTPDGSLSEDFFALLWKGKVFDRAKGRLINRVLGTRLVSAKVFYGPSWLDGKTSIIIDYKDTSKIAGFIRDEIRETSPGVYLGFAYARSPIGAPRADIVFALDFNAPKAGR